MKKSIWEKVGNKMTNEIEYLKSMNHDELQAVFKVIDGEVTKREKDIVGLRKLLEMIRAEITARGGRQ